MCRRNWPWNSKIPIRTKLWNFPFVRRNSYLQIAILSRLVLHTSLALRFIYISFYSSYTEFYVLHNKKKTHPICITRCMYVTCMKKRNNLFLLLHLQRMIRVFYLLFISSLSYKKNDIYLANISIVFHVLLTTFIFK